MHTELARNLWKAGLLLMSLVTLNPIAAATDMPETFQVVDGVAIYLGVMPAQIVRGHVREHEESKMHDGVPAGRYLDHVVVALFDDTSGRRIEDAQVTAAVSEVGMGLQWKSLESMRIAGTITYGNYFTMPDNGLYQIQLRIKLPGRQTPVAATFTHEHVAR